MIKKLFIFLCLASFIYGQNAKEITFDLNSNEMGRVFKWKYQFGDSAHWSQPEYNDSLWQVIEINKKPIGQKGIHWYRAELDFEGIQNEFELLALYFPSLVSAYEVFWDGQIIAQNGQVGDNKTSEIPGIINKIIKIKQDYCTSGKHLLTVRLSNFHEQSENNIYFVQIGYYSEIQSRLNLRYYWFQFSAGLFLLASIFSFALFLGGGRNRSYFLFAIFCILNVIFAALAFILNYISISIEYISFYNSLVFLIAPLAIIFLNIFFIYNYDLPHKIKHIIINAVLAILILLVLGYNFIAYLSLYAIILIFLAIRKKEPGSIIAFIGTTVFVVLLLLFANGLVFQLYNFGEVFFVFCITLSISYQIRKQNQQLEKSKLRSARLEAELLKKNIQPHFLMNTLLSIISWIEENPQTAQKLIQALANEFKMINKISSEKEIPVHEEIKLCKSHLELMGFRKDAKFNLILENIPQDKKIPPMIFHTLIENGLTHAFKTGENGTFYISFEEDSHCFLYKIQNSGSLLQKFSNQTDQEIHDGMGMKYIKTRLEESYPGKWEITYGIKNDMWEVNINIKK